METINRPRILKKHEQILILESDPSMRYFLNRILKSAGYDTLTVTDIDKALNFLYTIHPDMVVIDTINADKTDMEAIDRLREHSNVPIVVLADDDQIETLKNTFAHGADDFVHKPFGTRIFTARVNAKMRRAHLTAM
jgi:DNA-binding response OmpR family regulator